MIDVRITINMRMDNYGASQEFDSVSDHIRRLLQSYTDEPESVSVCIEKEST